jgi:hypothetical protein
MIQISQQQALTAFKLLHEHRAWAEKNCARLGAYDKRPAMPPHLLLKNIAAAAGMTMATLRRLHDEDFSVNKWNRAKVESWIKRLYPMTSSNRSLAGVRWRKLNP